MKLTLWTMYNYSNDTLFENMLLPDGIDHDTVVNSILDECGEFGVLYADLDWLKTMIGYWSKREVKIWERLYNTTLLEYNPIENYDRIEDSESKSTGNAVGKETAYESYELQTTTGSDSTGDTVFHGRIHGNIGVTSSQQLVEAERRVSEFNIYNYIVKSFRSRFVLDIYE